MLPKAEQKHLQVLKVKHTGYSYSLKISSHQAHVRKAEVMAVGEKQLHAGMKILLAFMKQIKDPRKLETQIDKVNKGTAKAYQQAMDSHWKKIARAESDGEKAVALAEKLRKEEAKGTKLGKMQWVKIVWQLLKVRKELVKLIPEFTQTRKSLLLAANAFNTEALRVEAEAGRGTPPVVIQRQREILAKGHVAQLEKHVLKMVTCCKALLNKLTIILRIASTKIPAAAEGYKVVINLQYNLGTVGEQAKKIIRVLNAFVDDHKKLITMISNMALGKVPTKKKLETDIKSQLNLDKEFATLLSEAEKADSAIQTIAKM